MILTASSALEMAEQSGLYRGLSGTADAPKWTTAKNKLYLELYSVIMNTEEDDTLREHLASAIANCCSWGNNCYEFGRLGAVTPLVGYMMSKERRVHRTTALALCQLSQDPFNCVTLHTSGVVPYLLKTIGSSDEVLQEASAGCLSNIRKLALASDRAKL